MEDTIFGATCRSKTGNYILIAILLFLVSGYAAWVILWATSFGIGVSPDSITYINTARNILEKHRIVANGSPVTHYPPVYPMVLALWGSIHGDVLSAAPYLHAFLFSANTLLIGMILCLSTRGSIFAVLAGTMLFALSPNMLFIHCMAWSESLFFFFLLLSYFLFVQYISREKRWYLIASSLVLGLSVTTRYIGVSAIIPLILFTFFVSNKKIAEKLIDFSIVISFGLTPLLIWFLRNSYLSGSMSNRSFVPHLISLHHIDKYFHTLFYLWFPLHIKVSAYVIISFILFIFIGYMCFCLKLWKSREVGLANNTIQVLFILFFLSYTFLLFVSQSFFDAHTPMSIRILSPLFIFFVIFSTSFFWAVSNFIQKIKIWYVFVGLLFLLVFAQVTPSALLAKSRHYSGVGYSSRTWHYSETMKFVKELPLDTIIYSNAPDGIQFLANRNARFIPRKLSTSTRVKNQHYAEEMKNMMHDLYNKNAVVVYFNDIGRWYLPSKRELTSLYNLPVYEKFTDGVIFKVD